MEAGAALALPLSPVRRAYIDGPPGFGVDPYAVLAAAGKNKRMRAITIDDRELKVAIGRRSVDLFPLHDKSVSCLQWQDLDLDQRVWARVPVTAGQPAAEKVLVASS